MYNSRTMSLDRRQLEFRPEDRVIFVVAHPDDTEVLFAHAVCQAHCVCAQPPEIIVATLGEASTVDWRGDGFVAGGGRRTESIGGLGALGFSTDRQHYLALADGKLEDAALELEHHLSALVSAHSATILVSFGPEGFDGHRDHIATFHAAGAVAARHSLDHYLRVHKRSPTSFTIEGDPGVKLDAMRHHLSQFQMHLTPQQCIDTPYLTQLAEEHYELAPRKKSN